MEFRQSVREGSIAADSPPSGRKPLTLRGFSSEIDVERLPLEIESQLARLRFDDAEVEADFLVMNDEQGLDGFRASVTIGMFGMIIWCLLDLTLVPDALRYTWPIRFGLAFSTLLLSLIGSFQAWFRRHLFKARVFVGLTSGMMMVTCSVVTGRLGHQYYVGGLMLNSVVCCVFPGQRFHVSAISIWSVFAAYQLAMHLDPDVTFELKLCNTIFLAAINVSSMAASYAIERFCRTTFIQRRIILGQSEALLKAMQEAERAAITDPLTGLYNRRRFFGEANLGQGRVSVIILDVDHFKSINDRFGHATGDRVLWEIAERVRAEIRPGDIACRYGGEEFAILLPGADLITSAAVGERIRLRIGLLPIDHIQVTVSVGVATVDEDALEIGALLDRADRALYEAKHAGRNRVKLWLKDRAVAEVP